MKREMIKLLTLILSVGFVVNGCSKAKESTKEIETNTNGVTQAADAGKLPLVKDKINLKVFNIQRAEVTDFYTNEYTKFLEEKTNVHIDWVLALEKDAANKVKLILASNSDLPDIFLWPRINPDTLVNYGQQGVFIPLNKYIEEYGVEIKRIQANYPSLLNSITAPDGNIYSLFIKNESLNVQYSNRFWMNKTFLDKLNLKMPTTTDELYTVLKAFKDKDPNGNGKADEIPLSGFYLESNKSSYIDSFVMNAFTYNDPGRNRLYLKDGKVEASFIKPEFKKGLEFYRKLYKEGLLDPLAFTQDQKQLTQLVNNKNAAMVGAVTAANTNQFIGAQGERIKDYVSVPPLKGPDGFRAAVYNPSEPVVGNYIITNVCKHPDVAFRMGDYMLSEEASLFSRFGVPEKDWVKGKSGDIGANGQQAVIKPIMIYGLTQNSTWGNSKFQYISEKISSGITVAPNNPFDFETILYKASKEYEPFAYKDPLPTLIHSPEEASEISMVKAQINAFVTDSIVKFITKDIDFDKEWNKYISELDKLQINRLIDLTQKGYDRQFKNKK